MPNGNCDAAVTFGLGFGVGSPCSGIAQIKRAANAANRGFTLAVLTSPCTRYKQNPLDAFFRKSATEISRQRSPTSFICSIEHESGISSILDAHIAQTDRQTSADGTRSMESPSKPLKAMLEAIRDLATNALNQIAKSQEEYSMHWRCKDCQYTKHFTRAVTLEAAGKCPRCKCTEFRPVL